MDCLLIVSRFCSHSLQLLALIEYFKVPLTVQEVPFLKAQPVPGSIYGETPILCVGDLIVEDHRAILYYLDRHFVTESLLGETPTAQATTIDLLELLDTSVFRVVSAAGIREPGGYRRSLQELGAPSPILFRRHLSRLCFYASGGLSDSAFDSKFAEALTTANSLLSSIESQLTVQLCLFGVLRTVSTLPRFQAEQQNVPELFDWFSNMQTRFVDGTSTDPVSPATVAE